MPSPQVLARLPQQQFQDKLNEVVRIVKQKQQTTLQLIQYLQQILANVEQLSKMMFLQDEISRHKHFFQRISKREGQSGEKMSMLEVFYQQQQNAELDETEKSLVRRVSARILEMFQSYNQKVEKYVMFQRQISSHYRAVKPRILKAINQVDRNGATLLSIGQLSNIMFTYLDAKFGDQCRKINKIIELIENGEIHMIRSVFVCEHCRQLEMAANETQQLIKVSVHKEQTTTKLQQKGSQKNIELKPVQETEQQKYFTKQKQKINQKLKAMRQQAKARQTIKKKKLKFATKYYSLMHQAMDLHKGFFIDEFTHLDENEQRGKVLAEIQHRNKHNSVFIREHIYDCVDKDMEARVVEMAEVLAKEREGNGEKDCASEGKSSDRHKLQLKKDSFDLVIERDEPQPVKLDEDDHLPQAVSHPEISLEIEEKTAELKSFRITTNQPKKPVIPTPKSNPNLFSIKEFGQVGQSFNFVKINMKNPQIHRSRLPDISNRLFSMQEKHKSAKLIDKLEGKMSPDNHLLIIKTSLSKPIIQHRKIEKKKKLQQHSKNDNGVIKVQRINIEKIEKLQRKGEGSNSISPIIISPISTITTIARSKKVRRSQSGNKIIVEQHDKGSFKTLEVNYSATIVKKAKNFAEVVSLTEDREGDR